MNNFITAEGFEKTFRYVKLIQQGLLVTILLALFTVIIGFVLGIVLAIMRMTDIRPLRFLAYGKNGRIRNSKTLIAISKFNPVSFLATAYVEILRSTPVIVQIMIIYHGVFGKLIDLPNFTLFGFLKFNRFFPGVVALGMNSGAYLCEIIRSGIQSIPQGQYEAAQVLGYTKGQTFFTIILPQVVKRVLLPVCNEVITLIKDTALANCIIVCEIIKQAKELAATKALVWPLFYTGVFYLIFVGILTIVLGKVEKKLSYFRS